VGSKNQKKRQQPRSSVQAFHEQIFEALELGYVLTEKCELEKAKEAFVEALDLSKKFRDFRAQAEAISCLLWLAGEANDPASIEHWERELDSFIRTRPKHVPPMVWYCKGAIARHQKEYRVAQRHFHRYLRGTIQDGKENYPAGARVPTTATSGVLYSAGARTYDEAVARGWAMLAIVLHQRGFVGRAKWLAQEILRRYETKKPRTVMGLLYLFLGKLAELKRELNEAVKLYQRAHASFLGEHNWYYHLHVLYAYARIARLQQNYPQAYWYLDLLEKATSGSGFGAIKKEILAEKNRLEQDAVDLLIDGEHGVIRTREGGQISLRKQYVLLNILEALSEAHGRDDQLSRGLSKAEIIERVWNERYRPEAHDNKLYYNINRLRKLIEPDIRNPQYLLNWREGYRLAPGLRIQFIHEMVRPESLQKSEGDR
jgi:DNA-binding winged helix-turn-helix (wHTH) protein